MSIISEFKEFALKGNFLDLAVGVVIGAASSDVVKSLTDKIIMPPIGLVLGKVNFAQLKYVLQAAQKGPDGKEIVKEVAIGYGAAIQSLINFFIIAFVVFLVVRAFNRMRKKKEAAPAAPPAPSAEEKLLGEIRDLLANKPAASEP